MIKKIMDKIVIPGEVSGEIEPPSSKSYAQRAIAAALLADGVSTLSCVEICDDTAAALRVVQTLGAKVSQTAPGTYAITGGFPKWPTAHPLAAGETPPHDKGGWQPPQAADGVVDAQPLTLDIAESGLSTRLFTPIAALNPTPITITGHGTILHRPMDAMFNGLRALGVEVTDKRGCLPVTVRGPVRGGEIEIDGGVSSQFLTGLLIAMPLAAADTTERVARLSSFPYINMTLDVMSRFGVEIDHRDYEEFYIPGAQRYSPTEMTIEGDWSAASCLLVAGATSGEVTVRRLNPVSLQADVAIIEALSRAGAHIEQTTDSVTVSRPRDGEPLRAFTFDATDCPDLFPALAALAASCEGVSTIIGTSRLVHKESDRARAIHSEYHRLGIEVDISEDDVMKITGRSLAEGEIPLHVKEGWRPKGDGVVAPITVDSHADHRIAMSLAVAALRADAPVKITGAECVSKSYADFWHDYEQLWA
jgi:3-phosphoshikimate 1-carboxyvinyltransferase